jgi:dolichyl-phosphate beta-glucosyltransferase
MTEPHLSLVIPVYNAGNHIRENLETVVGYLKTQGFPWELIVVDDGSGDETPRILSEMRKIHPEIKTPANGRNHGKGFAVRNGFEQATGKYLVFNDSDLAYPIEEVVKILRVLEGGSDLAIACRVLPESRFEISPAFFRYLYTRHLMGRFFNRIVRSFILPGILDTQAGLKGFTREAARRIFAKQTLNRFSFDVEVLYLAKKEGFKIEQVPVNFRYFFEESTVRFFRDTVRMLRDLWRIKRNNRKGVYS